MAMKHLSDLFKDCSPLQLNVCPGVIVLRDVMPVEKAPDDPQVALTEKDVSIPLQKKSNISF